MWNLWGPSRRFCDGVTRRDVMQVGALASAGLTLPVLLQQQARAAANHRNTPRSAILVLLAGGPSHFETFDPKPDAPLEIRGPYSPISTNVPGIQICETLPRLAQIADKYSLIRSCAHDNPGHGGGQRYVQTGYKSASLEDERPHDYPQVGSVISRMRGPMNKGLPTFLKVPGVNDGGAAYLGNAYSSFGVYSTGKPVGLELTSSVNLSRIDDRRSLRQSLDRMERVTETRRLMDSMDQLESQAVEMITNPKAKEAFDVSRETVATRERYGSHEPGKCCLLARRFVEAGAGLVSIRMGSWDHHGNAGGTITSGVDANAPQMDQAVSTLISDLAERGLSDQVLVWVWGEFGRTPRINSFFGRDHWPQAMSVLMAGGGIRPGRVIGATNQKGEHPADRPLSPADVLATVYRQLDVDTSRQFLNLAGRPVSILSDGKPIAELL